MIVGDEIWLGEIKREMEKEMERDREKEMEGNRERDG